MLRQLLWLSSTVITFIRENIPWLWQILDLFTLALVDLIRLYAGGYVAHNLPACHRPVKMIQLYEYEGCPSCRYVRETLSTLDITYEVFPCPRESLYTRELLNSRFRYTVQKEGGKLLFPFMIDPNNDVKMYNSDKICEYLWRVYGDKAKPRLNYVIAFCKPYRVVAGLFVMLLRPCLDMGFIRGPSKAVQEPLELYGYENSMGTRRVRELLSCLEIRYICNNLAVGSLEKRKEPFLKQQEFCVPYVGETLQLPHLYDPTTSVRLTGSSAIIHYLKDTYQTASVPTAGWRELLM